MDEFLITQHPGDTPVTLLDAFTRNASASTDAAASGGGGSRSSATGSSSARAPPVDIFELPITQLKRDAGEGGVVDVRRLWRGRSVLSRYQRLGEEAEFDTLRCNPLFNPRKVLFSTVHSVEALARPTSAAASRTSSSSSGSGSGSGSPARRVAGRAAMEALGGLRVLHILGLLGGTREGMAEGGVAREDPTGHLGAVAQALRAVEGEFLRAHYPTPTPTPTPTGTPTTPVAEAPPGVQVLPPPPLQHRAPPPTGTGTTAKEPGEEKEEEEEEEEEKAKGGDSPWSWALSSHTGSLTLLRGGKPLPLAHASPSHATARAHALRCLAGQRISFVGDSLMRYQYLNLLHWWRTGNWSGPPGQPPLEDEGQWGGWGEFFRGTSQRIEAGGGGGEGGGRGSGAGAAPAGAAAAEPAVVPASALCDCWRERGEGWIETAFEHRYFREAGRGGGALPVEFNYHFLLGGGVRMRGHERSWLGADNCTTTTTTTTTPTHPGVCVQTGCAIGQCNSTPTHWSALGPLEALGRVARLDRPHTIVLNSGIWEAWTGEGRVGEVAAGGRAAGAEGVGALVWKTTGPVKGGGVDALARARNSELTAFAARLVGSSGRGSGGGGGGGGGGGSGGGSSSSSSSSNSSGAAPAWRVLDVWTPTAAAVQGTLDPRASGFQDAHVWMRPMDNHHFTTAINAAHNQLLLEMLVEGC